MIMRRVDGRIPADDPPYTTAGWVLELNAEDQARLPQRALDVLAKLHAADPDAIGLGSLKTHPEAGLDGQLRFYREFYTWAAHGEENPTIEGGFRWLEEQRPAELGDQVITWGDARIGNIIYRDDLSVGAVLDWEMVAYGPAAMDLGWMLFINRFHTEGIGAPLPVGFPSPEQTVAQYERLTGRAITDLSFWEVLAAVKLSVMLHRAGTLMVEHGLLPPDATMKFNNPATQLLAKLAGLPAPAGAVQNFVGKR
jgi:aminoglycoside phosphotransferase (APT) family kinase protein